MSALAMSQPSSSLTASFATPHPESSNRGVLTQRFTTPGPPLIVGAILSSALSSGLWGLIAWTAWRFFA